MLVNNAGVDQPPDAGGHRSSHRAAADRPVPADGRGEPPRHVPGDAGDRRADGRRAAAAPSSNRLALCVGVAGSAVLRPPAGELPFLKSPAYGASKAAVVNMTKYFATLWGRAGCARQHVVARRCAGRAGRPVQVEVRRPRAAGADGAGGRFEGAPRVSRVACVVVRHRTRAEGRRGFTAW